MNSMVRNIQKVDINPAVSAESFRGAMRHLAGGVSVITAGQGPDITGMTVTSVTSLAVEQATLVVSVNRASSSWPRISKVGAFGVNILGADHAEIAKRFAGIGGLKGQTDLRVRNGPRSYPARRCWSVHPSRSTARWST